MRHAVPSSHRIGVQRSRTARLGAATLLTVLAVLVQTAGAQTLADQLRRLSLDQLINLEVTTVSRIPVAGSNVPAAIHVITAEEIRRSGATTLPEALRLAPGIHVARIDSSKWAIGIRGFTGRLARSMLTLIDGRAVYSPLFAGTYWEVQDLLLEDIERIEVVRGPGGTLWGANAVNGIVNIVTKRSAETQGWLVQAGGGNQDRATAAFRYGGDRGQDFGYRVYGKYRDSAFRPGGSQHGDWKMGQAGFRADWTRSAARTVTIQGDIYRATDEQVGLLQSFVPPYSRPAEKDAELAGGNLLGRLEGRFSEGSDFRLQLYYDRTRREDLALTEERDTVDIDFQHTFAPFASHRFAWGLSYRLTSDDTAGGETEQFLPASRTSSLFGVFVHDEMTLLPERLVLTLGSKIEHNVYSGFETQPSARIAWSVATNHTMFASVAHAVRTPTRVEQDYQIHTILDPGLPAFLRKVPNDDFAPETIVAYEAGYRVRPADRLFVTLSGFFNQHDDLLSTEVSAPIIDTESGTLRVFLPLHWENNLHGNSHGVEVAADYRAADWWRWTGSYSGLRVQLTRDPDTSDLTQEAAGEGSSPNHQVQLRSSIDLGDSVDFDWAFRYVSRFGQGTPSYASSDLRLAWRPGWNVELSIVGKDLLDPRHLEFAGGNQIERRAYGEILWRLP